MNETHPCDYHYKVMPPDYWCEVCQAHRKPTPAQSPTLPPQVEGVLVDFGRRLDAYYYGFDATTSVVIDDILSAVAIAGKMYHATECWNEEQPDGMSPVDVIQETANRAAAHLAAQAAEVERLREMAGLWKEHALLCSPLVRVFPDGTMEVANEASAERRGRIGGLEWVQRKLIDEFGSDVDRLIAHSHIEAELSRLRAEGGGE